MFLLSMYSLQTVVAPAILRPMEDHLSTGPLFLSIPSSIKRLLFFQFDRADIFSHKQRVNTAAYS